MKHLKFLLLLIIALVISTGVSAQKKYAVYDYGFSSWHQYTCMADKDRGYYKGKCAVRYFEKDHRFSLDYDNSIFYFTAKKKREIRNGTEYLCENDNEKATVSITKAKNGYNIEFYITVKGGLESTTIEFKNGTLNKHFW